jgi:hypothetical protein
MMLRFCEIYAQAVVGLLMDVAERRWGSRTVGENSGFGREAERMSKRTRWLSRSGSRASYLLTKSPRGIPQDSFILTSQYRFQEFVILHVQRCKAHAACAITYRQPTIASSEEVDTSQNERGK